MGPVPPPLAAEHRGSNRHLIVPGSLTFSWRSPTMIQDVIGLEAAKQYVAGTRLAYSDTQMIYDEWVAEGDAIAYRYHCSMKHTGTSPSLPVPPTGKELTLHGCLVVHVKEGKVIEEWKHSDYLGFWQQLGIVPPLG